jgi:hypothetical protein
VAHNVRGEREEGVRMSLVLDASIGESNSDDIAADAVAIKTDATGAVDVSIDALGIAPVLGGASTSTSAMPNTAASKPRKKVSSVRDSMLYMNVVLVPRHSESAPLLADKDDSTSSRERVFLSCIRYGEEVE